MMNKSLTQSLIQKVMLMEFLHAGCDLFKYTLVNGKQGVCSIKQIF